MLSRNQIRQAALQYLYAASHTPETEQEGIWDNQNEPFRRDYCKLKAKAVSGHLTRDYPDKLRLFITRARETADKLQQDPLTLPVRDQLQDLLTKEGEFNAALLRLKKALHEDPANDKGSLSAACAAAQESAQRGDQVAAEEDASAFGHGDQRQNGGGVLLAIGGRRLGSRGFSGSSRGSFRALSAATTSSQRCCHSRSHQKCNDLLHLCFPPKCKFCVGITSLSR